MPRRAASPDNPPKYRRHKARDLAVVRIDGRDIYLGKYDSKESREKYFRLLAEWALTESPPQARPIATTEPVPGPSVNEVVLAYFRHAQSFYRRDGGEPTAEVEHIRLALRHLKNLYGSTEAAKFGPKALMIVRQSMIDAGLSRRTINQRIARICRAFRFAAKNELVPAQVFHELKTVEGLPRGRSGAKESKTVGPAPDADVDAVRPFVSRQIWAMIQLQRLTGMRSGEVAKMRTVDVDASGSIWFYTPERHKGTHRGKQRRIAIGPRAQELLRAWLKAEKAELGDYLFSPKDAMEEHLAKRKEARKTPLTPSQEARQRKAKPKKQPGDAYSSRVYAHAVARACERAGVPHWHPHQLRHNAATVIRRECGLETARAILGHSSAAVTEIYAERDESLAISAVERLG